MKKKYMKPSMKVYEIGMTKIICGSDPNNYPGNFNYIPTIPGQPDDEKHLA